MPVRSSPDRDADQGFSLGRGQEGGTANPLPTGWHVFFVIDDGRQLAAFATALFNGLATLGYALVEPSKRGAKLRRALVLIELRRRAPSELIFEAQTR